MKLYRDKLAGVRNVHSKYQVSWTSGSLFLYCRILQNCNLLYLLELGCHKNQYNDMKLYMDKLTGIRNLHSKYQVSRTSESLFLYCRILHNCYFWYFFELGFYKNWGIDMIFCMDNLARVKHVHTKFQVSRISGSWFLGCKIHQNCDFLYFFECGW